jgi:hypothetical protein
VTFFFPPEKLQNVMAVTEVLALFWHIPHHSREEVAMKKELMLVALRFGLVIAPIAVTYLVS